MKNKIETGIDGLEEYIFDEIETDQKISDFVDYVHQFYGKDGIYAEEFFPPNGATPAEIVLAVTLMQRLPIKSHFSGDSMDREIVRDIIAQARLAEIILNKKKEKTEGGTKINWKNYTKDLDIPDNWDDTSYGNDALPSYMSDKINEYHAYHIWIDSHDAEERKANSEDIYGLHDELAPRFHVVLCYGNPENVYSSDDFDSIVQWIKDNPKTPEQIEETKEYI